MKVNFSLSLEEKLQILSDAAKYDVACTSSGSDRRGKKAVWGTPVLQVSVTALPQTEGVFLF